MHYYSPSSNDIYLQDGKMSNLNILTENIKILHSVTNYDLLALKPITKDAEGKDQIQRIYKVGFFNRIGRTIATLALTILLLDYNNACSIMYSDCMYGNGSKNTDLAHRMLHDFKNILSQDDYSDSSAKISKACLTSDILTMTSIP